jgi:hypothetical protein
MSSRFTRHFPFDDAFTQLPSFPQILADPFLLPPQEAQHNVGPPDHSKLDPELTSRGTTQCAAIPSTYPTFFASLDPENTVILTSPLKRTIQTTLLGFSSLLPSSTDKSVPLIILPELQGAFFFLCCLLTLSLTSRTLHRMRSLPLRPRRTPRRNKTAFPTTVAELGRRRSGAGLEQERGAFRGDGGEERSKGEMGEEVFEGVEVREGRRREPSWVVEEDCEGAACGG